MRKEASKWTPCLVKGVLDTPQYCKDPKKKNTISWGIYNYSNHRLRKRKEDVRAICLRHLSAHWSAGLIQLIQLIWLARLAPPSLTTPGAPLLKLHIRWEMKTIPDRGGSVLRLPGNSFVMVPTKTAAVLTGRRLCFDHTWITWILPLYRIHTEWSRSVHAASTRMERRS